MYLGETTIQIPNWQTRWVPGCFERGGRIEEYRCGTRPKTMHLYRCEHCGVDVYPQNEMATERFYCECGLLVGIQPVETANAVSE